jgi:hypothetical protein
MRYATNGCIAFARCPAILAQDEPSPIPGVIRDRGSPNRYADIIADFGIVAIPYDYREKSAYLRMRGACRGEENWGA